jgi:hypothetical protein
VNAEQLRRDEEKMEANLIGVDDLDGFESSINGDYDGDVSTNSRPQTAGSVDKLTLKTGQKVSQNYRRGTGKRKWVSYS